ncbi:MAG: peptidylprolyl isomerase [Thiotrichales bacterium]
MNPPRIRPNSRVVMHYRLGLPDGTEVDASAIDEPLSFALGDGTMIPGLEFALLGLVPGALQTVTIDAATAYGARDPAAVHWMPRSDFPATLQPVAGQILSFGLPTGDEVPGAVLAVEEKRVQVDLNHPLAGREVVFSVEILAVENPIEAPQTGSA